jgi:RimJ/RimL family protein N-acetyltransferase
MPLSFAAEIEDLTQILQTERLILREIDASRDAEFLFALLNAPKFRKYIGDRGVRSIEEAAKFADERYMESYRIHGYGLYVVDLKPDDEDPVGSSIGICGFVRRDTLPEPDIGFAFLPEFEGNGYARESAEAMMQYGRDVLGFERVLAITTLDNVASIGLLKKLGFTESGLFDTAEGETLRLFSYDSN